MNDCGHAPCPDCGWCPCWYDDPAGNTPPVPIAHAAWHGGLPLGLTDDQVAELSHAPVPVPDIGDDPADIYHADDMAGVW